jgi:hypothetical protein
MISKILLTFWQGELHALLVQNCHPKPPDELSGGQFIGLLPKAARRRARGVGQQTSN